MKLKHNSINYSVDTVDALLTLVGEENDVVVVTDENRGGTFVYRSADSATNNSGTIFNGWTRQYDGAVNVKWFGLTNTALDQHPIIQSAVNLCLVEDKWLDYDVDYDINISLPIDINSNFKMNYTGNGFIIKNALGVNADSIEAIIALPKDSTFKNNVNILGFALLKYDSGIVDVNKRGKGTVGFYYDNLNKSNINIKVGFAEQAVFGYSLFGTRGKVEAFDCHEGMRLLPSALDTGITNVESSGNSCTSLDFDLRCDRVIFPLTGSNIFYSNFTGYVQATRQNLSIYESDELASALTLEGGNGLTIAFGIESWEGIVLSNQHRAIALELKATSLTSNDDYFLEDATRINNISYANQAVYSVYGASSKVKLTNSLYSGGNITDLVGTSHLFKTASTAQVNIDTSKIQSGNYIFSNRTDNFETYLSKESAKDLHDIKDDKIELGNGMVAYVKTASINASGEFVATVSGTERIFSAHPIVVRGIYSADHAISLKTQTDQAYTFICGLGAGYTATIYIIAFKE